MSSEAERQKDKYGELKPYLGYFIFAVLTGVLVYFSLMANHLVNDLDGIWHPSNFIAGDWEISLGRGLQRYADRARFGLVSNPWNSILVFALFGWADCLIIKRFKLEKTFFSYLFVFITIASPVMAESLTYSYMSVNFALAYAFSVAAFYFVPTDFNGEPKQRLIIGLAVSTLLFAASMAFYQAYIGVFAVLCIFALLGMLKDGEEIKSTLKAVCAYLITFVTGGVIYFIITKLLLLRAGVEMASYKGASGAGIGNMLINLPGSLVKTYTESYRYFITGRLNANLEFSAIMVFVVSAALIYAFVSGLVRLIKTDRKQIAFFVILSVLLPVAACCICLLAVGNSVTGLMAMGVVMGIVMFYTIADGKKVAKIVMNAAFVLMAWYMVSAVENDQIALKEGMTATRNMTENALAEMYDGNYLAEADSVAFVGRAAENPLFYKSVAYESANAYAQFGRWSTDPRNNRTTWMGITQTMCGVSLPLCGEGTYAELINTDEVRNMPVYPEAGYMEVIDGVLVIKMSDLY